MNLIPTARILTWVLIQFVCVIGQQGNERVGFIPRTDQNSKRVQHRLAAIQNLKYQMQFNQMKSNGMASNTMQSQPNGAPSIGMQSQPNGMPSNGMQSPFNGMSFNGMQSQFNGIPSNGMGSNSMRTNGMRNQNVNGGFTVHSGMFQDPLASQDMTGHGQMGVGYMHPEQIEAIADVGGMLPMSMASNGGMATINVDMMGSVGMDMATGGMTSNRGSRMGTGGRGGNMMLPMCQPITECAEIFIPPQCRSWRYDTVNNIMCRACPINRCEGGVSEYFNTMYEYHPSRLLFKMLQ